ncbi:hypothetical protein [Metabacillus fastidiosus]|uniref:hypothetical protein n=1 Tax=Metabacillus fastidiosus TaxID=1458 RepID=UPI003D2CEC72
MLIIVSLQVNVLPSRPFWIIFIWTAVSIRSSPLFDLILRRFAHHYLSFAAPL